MTEKQNKLYLFINSFINEKGFVPSYQQMCDGIGVKSKSQIHSFILSLERQGYLKRIKGKSRSLKIKKDYQINKLKDVLRICRARFTNDCDYDEKLIIKMIDEVL